MDISKKQQTKTKIQKTSYRNFSKETISGKFQTTTKYRKTDICKILKIIFSEKIQKNKYLQNSKNHFPEKIQ